MCLTYNISSIATISVKGIRTSACQSKLFSLVVSFDKYVLLKCQIRLVTSLYISNYKYYYFANSYCYLGISSSTHLNQHINLSYR